MGAGMKIYSSMLTPQDLHRATIGIPLYLETVVAISRPKLRKHGYRVRALGYGARQANSGKYGASGESSASWDDHGTFFARIFEADPMALIVAVDRYDGRAEFHVKTGNKYHPIGAWYDDPKRVEKGD
jgi:hypothetical protein